MLVGLALASASLAADGPVSGMLDLPTLASSVSEVAPEVVSARAARDAQASLVRQAGAMPDPELEFEIEDLALTNTDESLDPLMRVRLAVPTEGKGKRAARIAVAEAELAVADADLLAIAWEAVRELAADWVEAVGEASLVRVEQASLDRLEESHRLAQAQFDAGEMAGSELHRLTLEVELQRNAVQRAQDAAGVLRDLIDARLSLGGSTSIPSVGDVWPTWPVIELGAWQGWALQRPDLRLARAELARLEAERDLVAKESRVDRTYAVQLERQGDELTTGVGLSIPLQRGGSGTGAAQDALTTRIEGQRAVIARLEAAIPAEIAVRVGAVLQAQSRRDGLTALLAGTAARTAESTRLRWQAGEGTLLDYLDAERQRLEVEAALVEAELDLARARLDLLLAAGLYNPPTEGVQP